jgi:hypothetical protein
MATKKPAGQKLMYTKEEIRQFEPKKPAPPEEPPIPKATQESMKLQAEQEKADRQQKKEQKAGEKEVKDNMGRIGFKKGGSASSRADGCAIRGKTRA